MLGAVAASRAATPPLRVVAPPTRRPIVQCVVLVALGVLLATLVIEGGTSSSAEAFAINSAAQAAHLRALSLERRRRSRGEQGPAQRAASDSSGHDGSDAAAGEAQGRDGSSRALGGVVAKLRPRRGVIRWLAIGDSITQGLAPESLRRVAVRREHPANGTCSYLGQFNALVNAERRWVEFVGEFDSAHAGPYGPTCFAPHPRHCATWGITAERVSSNTDYRPSHRALQLGLDGTPRQPLNRGARVYDWVRVHRPDVVSILLGTNDLARQASHATLLDDFVHPIITQAMRAAEDAAAMDNHAHAEARRWHTLGRCELVVLLMTLLPRSDNVNVEVENFNEKLERRDRTWLSQPCLVIASVGDGLEAEMASHFYDGLHPAALGEQLIASNLVRELRSASET